MVDFCDAEQIPHDLCGKVIVAVDGSEVARLAQLAERARHNGVKVQLLDPDDLREVEPRAAGLRALHVPDTGIVDFRAVCERLADRITSPLGARQVRAKILYEASVHEISARGREIIVSTSAGQVAAHRLVNCAGLYSDRVARLAGQVPSVSIVAFLGQFYELCSEVRPWVRGLIYPVPDPRFPFLGVHLTRTVEGSVQCGPNALLALGREAYQGYSLDPSELLLTLTARGFWPFALKNWRAALMEFRRARSRRVFAAAVARLVPGIGPEHLTPAPAGIRAQALAADGRLVDDFVFEQTGAILSVCNAPSPAATASLAIAEHIADRVLEVSG
jgi:L-2-hydroxyglutarate oxidase LhgO